jgi:hypothetical protein
MAGTFWLLNTYGRMSDKRNLNQRGDRRGVTTAKPGKNCVLLNAHQDCRFLPVAVTSGVTAVGHKVFGFA